MVLRLGTIRKVSTPWISEKKGKQFLQHKKLNPEKICWYTKIYQES